MSNKKGKINNMSRCKFYSYLFVAYQQTIQIVPTTTLKSHTIYYFKPFKIIFSYINIILIIVNVPLFPKF